MPSSEYFIHDKVPDYLRVNIKSRHECLLGNESKFQGSLIRLWTTNWPRCRLGLAAVDAKDFSGVSLALPNQQGNLVLNTLESLNRYIDCSVLMVIYFFTKY